MAVDNTQGHATLDTVIKGLRSLPGMVKAAPAALVPVVKSECDKAIASGQSLDGEKWAPLVRGDKKPLEGSEKDLTVTPSGNILWIKIKNGLVFSQYGTHRQKARPILPTAGMPRKLGNAIRLGIVDMLPEFMNRKGGHKKPTRGIKWQ